MNNGTVKKKNGPKSHHLKPNLPMTSECLKSDVKMVSENLIFIPR